MSLLAKLFPGNDEVSKLEASLAENDSLRADLTVANERITELTALAEANVSLQAELTALAAEKETLAADITVKESEITSLKADVEAAKSSAGNIATEILAAIGQAEPLVIEDAPGGVAAKTMTLSAFNQLKPFEKMAFCKSGGKLS